MSIIKVKTGGITADAITDALIADDVVGTEHLTANEVDTTALGADAVTGAQLADDAVNSEHYTDGSVDTAHIADAQITTAKLSTAVLTGATDIGAAIADADLFLVDDGAGGTLRKTAASRIKTYVGANTPAFEAYTTGLQSITENAYVKMTMATEVFDTDSAYDNSTNYRFTPQTSGKYFVYAKGTADPSSYKNGRTAILKIYKNGSAIEHTKYDIMTHGNASGDGFTSVTPNARAVVDMNGSSDYLEAYFLLNTWSNDGAQVGSKQFGAYKIIT
jgi:hypothetical protein